MEYRKIIFVTPSFKTGGGNRVFVELANALCSQFKISIVAPNNSNDKHTFNLHKCIDVKSIGPVAKGKMSKVVNILKTIAYLNRHCRQDVIICSDPIFCMFMWLIRAKNLYRFIQADDYRIFDDGAILGRGLLLGIYKKLCLGLYQYKKTKFIFNSQYTYEQFCNDSKRTDVPYALVHPALDHNVFNSSLRTSVASNDNLSICLVARKHPSKGLVEFINVWRNLDIKYKNKIRSVVLISHDDLSCFDTSQMQIIQPSCDQDIAKAYCESDIFISTSWREGFGLPPLEAMACSCAVISSKSGGVNEYAVDGQNCLMFEPRNQEQLNKQLIRLIDDLYLRTKFAENGTATAANFTWDIAAQQFIHIINN